MKTNRKKIYGIIACSTMALSLMFGGVGFVTNEKSLAETTTEEIIFGTFDYETSTFKDATATSINKYKSVIVSLADKISGDERIILPEVEGYNVNTDISTQYSKVIELSEEKEAQTILEEFVRNIKFMNCTQQQLSIMLNKDIIENKVAYFAENDHYYQYIKFINEEDNKNWKEAYYAAKGMSYMGRQGYLATITSQEEDIFISKVTENEVGWLGGTILNVGDRNGQYYDTIYESKLSGEHQDHWIWACGPEIDDEFFDVATVTSSNCYEAYSRNKGEGYYFNWDTYPEPNNYDEFCLTTLNSGSGYSTGDILDYNYSWNNISYDHCTTKQEFDGYSAVGYVVEFGNKPTGDSNEEVSSNYVSAVTVFHSHTEGNWTEWTTSDSLPAEPGNYFLGCDVTLTDYWEISEGEFNFCLNGHVLNLNGKNISVSNGATLNLYNCDETTSHDGYIDADGLWHFGAGEGTSKTIYGGLITGGNGKGTYGGAISVNNSMFNMFGGTLAGNLVSSSFPDLIPANGGAINIMTGSKATIYGGNIEYNFALSNGGGIYCAGELEIYGGHIENNTATKGGGIYYSSTTNLTLGIETYIFNNKLTNGEQSNLYSTREKFINLGSDEYSPNDSMYVGVELENGSGVIVDSGYEYYEYIYNFVSDNTDYEINSKQLGEGYIIELVKLYKVTSDKFYDDSETNHGYIAIYYWNDEYYYKPGEIVYVSVYSVEGYMLQANSVKVKDSEISVNEEYVYETDEGCSYEYSFVMPEKDVNLTAVFIEYSAREENSISDFTINETFVYGETLNPSATADYGTIIYKYSDNEYGPFTTEIPTKVGTYYVTASVAMSDTYSGAYSDPISFTISKASNNIKNLTLENWVFGEEANIPSATADFGTIIYKYSTEENGEYTETIPTNAGTYWVKAIVEETDNYNGVESDPISFTISKASNNIKNLTLENWVFGEEANIPNATADFGTIIYKYSTKENGEYTTEIPTEAGKYWVKAIVEGTGNYNGVESDPFAFEIISVENDEEDCIVHWFALGLLLMLIAFVLILWFAFQVKDFENEDKKINIAPCIGFAVHFIGLIICSVFAKCSLCIIMCSINLIVLIGAVVLYILHKHDNDKNEKKKEDETLKEENSKNL